MAQSTPTLSADAAAAVAAARARPGQIATLVLPADIAWGMTEGHASPLPPPRPFPPDPAALARVAKILRERGHSCALIVRAAAGEPRGLSALQRICAATGARALHDLMAPRVLRGVGQFAVTRVAYRAEDAVALLTGLSDLVLVGCHPPVAPFAYPQFPSWLTPDGVTQTWLAHEHEDEVQALEALAEALGAPVAGALGARAAARALRVVFAQGVHDEGR